MRSLGLSLVILTLLVSVFSTNAALVAWYPLDEPNGTVMQDGTVIHNSAQNANNATMAWDTPTSVKTSSFTGSSLNFTGTDSMRVWTPSGMGIVPSFTWSLKIKTTKATCGLINHSTGPWDYNDHNQLLWMTDGKIKFGMTGTSGNSFGTNATYNDGQWHTITLVAYYENLGFFIDGVQLTNDELWFQFGTGNNWFPYLHLAPDTYNYWLGAGITGGFVGEMKDVRFYNKAISAREIALIAGRTDLYDDPNLIVRYKMDDANNITANGGHFTDSSGWGNNGGIAWDTTTSTHLSHFTGSSFAFEQDSVRSWASNLPISTKKPFTLAVWVKTTHGGTLFNRCSASDPWGWNGMDGYKQFSLTTSGQFATAGVPFFSATGEYPATGTISVADGQWHHVGAAFDGEGTTKIYIDGQFNVAQGQQLQDVNDYSNYLFMFGLGAGVRYIGEMADLRIYNKELTAAEFSAMAKVGDFDGDRKVDANDLKLFTDEWLNNYTTTPLTPTAIENGDFENYDATTFAAHWKEWVLGAVNYGSTSISQVALLTNSADVHGGSKAMTWDYNSIDTSGGNFTYTEIYYTFDTAITNIADYDQMRVWIKRHAGNSHEGLLYVKFLDGGLDTGFVGAQALLTESEGSSFANPDEWYEWVIDLNGLKFLNGYSELTDIRGIMFGVSDDGGTGGTGTIDIDDIRFVNLPVCSSNKAEDFNRDCVINFTDFTVFAQNWMAD